MIAAEKVVVILLAAGTSTRFGAHDKLSVPLDGLPLGLHAARTFGQRQFAARVAVTREGGPDFGQFGFVSTVNTDPEAGQSSSIRLGLAQARRFMPSAVLLALGDMPFLTIKHVDALLARFDATQQVIGSTDGSQACPPALFGAGMFGELEVLAGDSGARWLLHSAALITAPRSELADVDTPDDLRSIQIGRRLRPGMTGSDDEEIKLLYVRPTF